MQLADKVTVLNNGPVVEYGTHKELYVKGGAYTKMFDKQAQFYRDIPSKEESAKVQLGVVVDQLLVCGEKIYEECPE